MSRALRGNFRDFARGAAVADRAHVRALAIVALVCAVSSPVRAASPALTIELVDDQAVGVRVSAPVPPKTCATAPVIFEGVVAKGKPLTVSSDAFHLCVAQTEAPFATTSFGPWFAVQHVAGTTPVRIAVGSRRTVPDVPATPALYASPLAVSVTSEGRIGLRVAVGPAMPCTAVGNTILLESTIDEKAPRILETQASCVCIEHTYAPFTNAGWTNAMAYCRPQRCVSKICTSDPLAPFIVGLSPRAS